MAGFWLNIYKEQGWTSFQIVSRLRKILGIKKIGHAGTLDPFATGVLPIAVGEATKTIDYIMADRKKYAFTLTFGELRDTGDIDGEIIETSNIAPSEEEVKSIIPKFIGEIEQIPPKYSAIKIDGKRAYDLARKGAEFEMKARKIMIYDLKLEGFDPSTKSAKFVVECGKGTYIRTLSQDIAKAIGAIGYTSKLERLEVGEFKKESAITLDELEKYKNDGVLEKHTISINEALKSLPSIQISEEEEKKIRNGVAISLSKHTMHNDKIIKLTDKSQNIVALAKSSDNQIKAFKVFNNEE